MADLWRAKCTCFGAIFRYTCICLYTNKKEVLFYLKYIRSCSPKQKKSIFCRFKFISHIFHIEWVAEHLSNPVSALELNDKKRFNIELKRHNCFIHSKTSVYNLDFKLGTLRFSDKNVFWILNIFISPR